MKTLGLIIILFMTACGTVDDDPDSRTLPELPSQLASERADRITDNYTTVIGEVELGAWTNRDIDAPDYFHGYTFEVPTAQTLSFRVGAGAESEIRIYDASRNLVRRTSTQWVRGHGETQQFELSLEERGSYLLVLGPKYVWKSKYSFKVDCLAGCQANEDAIDVTVAELFHDPKRYDEKRVRIDGFLNISYAMCTKNFCTGENRCCNSCGAEQRFGDTEGRTGIRLSAEEGDFVCGGTNCTYRSQCTTTPGAYRIEGIFRNQGDEFLHTLEVLELNE